MKNHKLSPLEEAEKQAGGPIAMAQFLVPAGQLKAIHCASRPRRRALSTCTSSRWAMVRSRPRWAPCTTSCVSSARLRRKAKAPSTRASCSVLRNHPMVASPKVGSYMPDESPTPGHEAFQRFCTGAFGSRRFAPKAGNDLWGTDT